MSPSPASQPSVTNVLGTNTQPAEPLGGWSRSTTCAVLPKKCSIVSIVAPDTHNRHEGQVGRPDRLQDMGQSPSLEADAYSKGYRHIRAGGIPVAAVRRLAQG